MALLHRLARVLPQAHPWPLGLPPSITTASAAAAAAVGTDSTGAGEAQKQARQVFPMLISPRQQGSFAACNKNDVLRAVKDPELSSQDVAASYSYNMTPQAFWVLFKSEQSRGDALQRLNTPAAHVGSCPVTAQPATRRDLPDRLASGLNRASTSTPQKKVALMTSSAPMTKEQALSKVAAASSLVPPFIVPLTPNRHERSGQDGDAKAELETSTRFLVHFSSTSEAVRAACQPRQGEDGQSSLTFQVLV